MAHLWFVRHSSSFNKLTRDYDSRETLQTVNNSAILQSNFTVTSVQSYSKRLKTLAITKVSGRKTSSKQVASTTNGHNQWLLTIFRVGTPKRRLEANLEDFD